MASGAAFPRLCSNAFPLAPDRSGRARPKSPMKILVATEETQGRRQNDFCWAEEGEIVTFGSECADETVDGSCGCRRALRGVRSRKATTTFVVVERPGIGPGDLARIVAESLVSGGWYPGVEQAHPAAAQDALRLASIALTYAEGTVLERRDEKFSARAWRPRRGRSGPPTKPARRAERS